MKWVSIVSLLTLLCACDDPAPVGPPVVMSAKGIYKEADGTEKIVDLKVVDYKIRQSIPNPKDYTKLAVVLSFSTFLDGDTVQVVLIDGTMGQGDHAHAIPIVKEIKQLEGLVEVDVLEKGQTEFKPWPSTNYKIAYRPEGGYVPPSDTPVSQMPSPGIRIEFFEDTATTKKIPAGSQVRIHLVIDKNFKDENGKVVQRIVKGSNGQEIQPAVDDTGAEVKTASGKTIAATVEFKVQ